MKKTLTVSLLALALALLCGCTRELERAEYTLDSPVSVRCIFTGTITDSEAEGTFLADGGWSFTGTAQTGRLVSGEIVDYPCLMELAGEPFMGFYSGAVKDALPQGEGRFVSHDIEYTGSFSAGQPDSGEVTALPLSLSYREQTYTGLYSGSLQKAVPDGEGVFAGTSAGGAALRLSGHWEGGSPAGEGALTADRCETVLCGEAVVGSYDGECKDGIPSGHGSFSGRNGEGIRFTYEGEWENGLANGRGALRYESAVYFDRCGRFTDGDFTPDFTELLGAIGSREPCFALTDAQTDFIREYGELWNAEHDLLCFEDSGLKTVFNKDLTLRVILQKPEISDEPEWMSIYSLRVISADRVELSAGGPVFTCVTCYDSSYTTLIRLLIPQEIEGLVRARRIHAYAIPLGFSSYTTVNGETKDCLVMLSGDLVIAV